MATYALAAANNYYPRRINGDPIICVQHITAGLTDYIAPDFSADNTQNWGRNPASNVSWHDICDSDSAIPCLPGTYTAWHAAGYNSRSIGQEIGTGGTDWGQKPEGWVEKVLRNSAKLWAPHVIKYKIPLRKVNKAQVDAELAKGRNAKPLGFIGHGDLDPRNRTDPGLFRGKDTFPWATLFAYIQDEIDRLTGKPKVEDKPQSKPSSKVSIDSFDGLLGPNTIKAWQTHYANAGRLSRSGIDGEISTPSMLIREVQKDLKQYGYYGGAIDGLMGPQTWAGLRLRFGATTDKRAIQALQYDLWERGLIK